MVNVYLYTNESTPSVFYRATVPLEQLVNLKQITLVKDPKKADIIWVVRYAHPFKDFKGKKLIYTLDDDLWAISKEHKHYSDIQHVLPNVHSWLNRADVVLASTIGIGEKLYLKSGKDIIVAPNYIPDRWITQSDPVFNINNILLTVGFFGHDEDIIKTGLLKELSKIEKEYSITCFGSSTLPELQCINYKSSIEEFIVSLENYGGAIGAIPLVDSEFNRGKSNIKFLEYACKGILPVFNPVGEYEKLGRIFPNLVVTKWLETINNCWETYFDSLSKVRMYVKDNYSISKKISVYSSFIK